jgi:hypothetical protein
MKIYEAEILVDKPVLDLLSGKTGLYQEPIKSNVLSMANSFNSADAILIPHDAFYFASNPEYLKYLIGISQKKLVIFSDRGDFPKKPRIPNSVAIRVAINPGEDLSNKIVVPYNVESLDFLPFRKFSQNPTISFVGYVPRISPKRTTSAITQTGFHPAIGNGALVRKCFTRSFTKSTLNFNYVKRDSYGAHAQTDPDFVNHREEYLNQMAESDLVLSPRGDANASARFFEVISSGRVPIIPNTRIQLPSVLGSSLNTNKDFLLIRAFSGNRVREVMEFWQYQVQSDENYYLLQVKLRESFQKYFKYTEFMQSVFALDLRTFRQVSNWKL